MSLTTSSPSEVESEAAWTSVENRKPPTARHESALIAAGQQLYLLGGRGERALEVYDPLARSWSERAAPPFEINHMQAVSLGDRIYVVGALTGAFPEETVVANVLIYDTTEDRWSVGPEIPENRRRGAAGAAVHDGRIYLVGGNRRGHMSGYVAWFDVFDPATGAWTSLADAPHARDHFHAAVIDGKLYAAGGRRSSHDTGDDLNLTVADVDVYDFAADAWKTLDAPIPTPRAGATAFALNGQLIVAGGESADQQLAHSQVEAFDPTTGRWHALPDLPIGRHGTQAAESNGQVHIVAGSANRGGGPELADHVAMRIAEHPSTLH